MGCSLEGQKCITTTNAFRKILDEPNREPNKIWVDKRSEFYNRSLKSLQDNDREINSVHYEEKYVVAERCIRTLKSKICKYMTSI